MIHSMYIIIYDSIIYIIIYMYIDARQGGILIYSYL